jgi:hypothetical protein
VTPQERDAAAPFIDLVKELSCSLGLVNTKRIGEHLQGAVRMQSDKGIDKRLASIGAFELPPAERIELMFAALQRDFQRRQQLLAHSLTGSEVAKLCGWSRQTTHDRRKANKLLALEEKGKWMYPAWQFDSTSPSGVVEGLAAVLKELEHLMPMQKLLWLETPQPDLEGRTPITWLREGEIDVVCEHARGVARGQ